MKSRIWIITAAVVCAFLVGLAAYSIYSRLGSSGGQAVHYPYWCPACKAMPDISEVRPGEGSTTVTCIRCGKSPSYPVVACYKCRRHHVLYLVGDGRCPYCFPESLANVPQEHKQDLLPPEVKRLDR